MRLRSPVFRPSLFNSSSFVRTKVELSVRTYDDKFELRGKTFSLSSSVIQPAGSAEMLRARDSNNAPQGMVPFSFKQYFTMPKF
ncbi:hypothetical protein D918_02165 [Trichuris suis]|nr:hypothetical protein D918_02165 [Trichuris suis]